MPMTLKTVCIAGLLFGIGCGVAMTAVHEAKNALFPYKPTPDLCKAFGYLKSD